MAEPHALSESDCGRCGGSGGTEQEASRRGDRGVGGEAVVGQVEVHRAERRAAAAVSSGAPRKDRSAKLTRYSACGNLVARFVRLGDNAGVEDLSAQRRTLRRARVAGRRRERAEA